jgi:hypothetical protein
MEGLPKRNEYMIQTLKKYRHLGTKCPEGFEAAEGFCQCLLNSSGNNEFVENYSHRRISASGRRNSLFMKM